MSVSPVSIAPSRDALLPDPPATEKPAPFVAKPSVRHPPLGQSGLTPEVARSAPIAARSACKPGKSKPDDSLASRSPAARLLSTSQPGAAQENLFGVYNGWLAKEGVGADDVAGALDMLARHQGNTYTAHYDDWRDPRPAYDDGLDAACGIVANKEDQPFANGWNNTGFGAPTDGMMNLDHLLDQLTPVACDSGIFELLLADGDTLGVVVNAQPELLSFLLSPSNQQLTKILQPQQMELEGRLERRIRRNVKITVL